MVKKDKIYHKIDDFDNSNVHVELLYSLNVAMLIKEYPLLDYLHMSCYGIKFEESQHSEYFVCFMY